MAVDRRGAKHRGRPNSPGEPTTSSNWRPCLERGGAKTWRQPVATDRLMLVSFSEEQVNEIGQGIEFIYSHKEA